MTGDRGEWNNLNIEMLQFVTILEEILWFEESSGIGRLIENFEINLSLNYEEENIVQ